LSAGTVDIRYQIQGEAEAISSFRKVGQGSKQMASDVQGSSKAFDQTGQSVSKAGRYLDEYDSKIQKLEGSTTASLRQQASMTKAVSNAASGFALAGAAAVSLWNAYDNVSDSAKRVEIAEAGVVRAERQVSIAREALNKLQQSGTASALDLQQAQQQLVSAEGRLERSHLTLSNSQEALNEAWLQAATSIIPSVFTGISGLTTVVDSFRNRALAAQVLSARLGESMAGVGTAAGAATGPVGAFSAANTTAAGANTRVAATSAGASSGLTSVGKAAATSAIPLGAFTSAATLASGANIKLAATSATPLANFAKFGSTAATATPQISGAATATTGLGAAMSAAAVPITIAVAAILAAVTAVVAFQKNLFGLQDAVKGLRAQIDAFIGFPKELRQQFNDLEESGNSMITGFGEGLPVFNDFLKWLEDIGGGAKKTSEQFDPLKQQVNQVNEQINKLSPAVAELAKSWGLYDNAAAATLPLAQKQLAYLQELDSSLEPTRKQVIDLAIANGVDLRKAISMTDEEMVEYIVNAKTLGPTLQQQAEMAAEAAKQFSEAWTSAFEKTKEQMGKLNEDMAGFARTAFENMGGEMDVASGHLKEKVAGSLGFNQDFWDKLFPRDVMHNVWEHNMDFDQLIADTKHIIERATRKGFITKDQASKWFGPLLDFMREDMPEDAGQAFGYLVSSIPELMDRLKPAIVRGFEIGPDVKEAVDNGIVQPFLDVLGKGLGADVAGPMMVDIAENMMNQFIASGDEALQPLAGMLKSALVDPLTQQERPVQEQVRRIVELLGEINPGFEEKLMGFDKNADKVGDITQNEILDPVETMKRGILEAFETIFRVMGKTDWADAIAAELKKATENFDAIARAAYQAKPQIEGVNRSVWDSLDPLEQLAVKMGAGKEAIARTTKELNSFGRSLDKTTGLFQGNIEAFDKWAEAIDESKLSLNKFFPTNKQAAESQDLWSDADMEAWAKGQPTNIGATMTTGLGGAISGAATAEVNAADFSAVRDSLYKKLIDSATQALRDFVTWAGKVTDFDSAAKVFAQKIAQGDWLGLGAEILKFLVNAATNGLRDFVAWAAKVTDFESMWQSFKTKVTELAVDVLGAGMFEKLKESVTKGLRDMVTWGQKVTDFASLWQNFKTAVSGLAADILSGEIFQKLKESATKGLRDMVGWAQRITDFDSLWNEFVNRIQSLNILDIGTAIKDKLTSAIADGIDKAKAWVQGGLSTLGDLGKAILDELANSIAGKALRGTDPMTGALNDRIKGVFHNVSLPTTVAGELGPLQHQLTTALVGMFGPDIGPQIEAAIETFLPKAVESGAGKVLGVAQKSGEDIANSLADGMDLGFQSNQQRLLSALEQVMAQLPETGSRFIARMKGILEGGELNKSIAIGMSGMKAAVDTELAKITEAMRTAHQQWGGIISQPIMAPAVKAGGFTAQGGANVGVGFNATADVGQMQAPGQQAPSVPVPDFTEHIAAWNKYVTDVGTIVAGLGAKLQESFTLIFTTLAEGLTNTLGSVMVTPWQTYITAVGQQISTLGTALVGSFNLIFSTVSSALGTFLGGMVTAWGGHVSAVGTAVNAIGGHLQRLVQGYGLTLRGVQQFAAQGSAAMNTFKSNVGAMANASANHLSRLASAVSSTMSRIVSSMNNATSAANRLRNAINSLRDKTITVTTRYRTVGRASGSSGAGAGLRGQHGLNTVVTQPTRLMVGEGYKPELVQVTPLAGSAMAKTTTGGSPAWAAATVRAGRGSKKAVAYTEYYEDGKKIIYYTDGSRKKSHYKIGRHEDWRSAVARESGEPYERDIGGRGDYRTPSGFRYTSEDMYKLEEENRQKAIKKAQEKAQKGSTKQEPTYATYSYLTKKGKVKEKKYEVDPETGAAHKGSAESYLTFTKRVARNILGGPIGPPPGMGGRYGIGGIWQHAAFGGKGDIFPFPLPPGFKKTLSKTYYPDGSVWNNYSDGSREMIHGPRAYKKKKKRHGQYGYSGIVSSATEFMAGEGGKPERVSIEPMYSGKGSWKHGSGADREIIIKIPLIVDGKEIARATGKHILSGISSFT
jgi:hypothetical protein